MRMIDILLYGPGTDGQKLNWARRVQSDAVGGGPVQSACGSSKVPQVVLTAPRLLVELEQNLTVLELPPMSKQKRGPRQHFGDLIYGAGNGAFETSWP